MQKGFQLNATSAVGRCFDDFAKFCQACNFVLCENCQKVIKDEDDDDGDEVEAKESFEEMLAAG